MSSSPSQPPSSLPEKIRKPKACLPCKSGHLRCDSAQPSCSRCVQRHQTCVYPSSIKQPERKASRTIVFVEHNFHYSNANDSTYGQLTVSQDVMEYDPEEASPASSFNSPSSLYPSSSPSSMPNMSLLTGYYNNSSVQSGIQSRYSQQMPAGFDASPFNAAASTSPHSLSSPLNSLSNPGSHHSSPTGTMYPDVLSHPSNMSIINTPLQYSPQQPPFQYQPVNMMQNPTATGSVSSSGGSKTRKKRSSNSSAVPPIPSGMNPDNLPPNWESQFQVFEPSRTTSSSKTSKKNPVYGSSLPTPSMKAALSACNSPPQSPKHRRRMRNSSGSSSSNLGAGSTYTPPGSIPTSPIGSQSPLSAGINTGSYTGNNVGPNDGSGDGSASSYATSPLNLAYLGKHLPAENDPGDPSTQSPHMPQHFLHTGPHYGPQNHPYYPVMVKDQMQHLPAHATYDMQMQYGTSQHLSHSAPALMHHTPSYPQHPTWTNSSAFPNAYNHQQQYPIMHQQSMQQTPPQFQQPMPPAPNNLNTMNAEPTSPVPFKVLATAQTSPHLAAAQQLPLVPYIMLSDPSNAGLKSSNSAIKQPNTPTSTDLVRSPTSVDSSSSTYSSTFPSRLTQSSATVPKGSPGPKTPVVPPSMHGSIQKSPSPPIVPLAGHRVSSNSNSNDSSPSPGASMNHSSQMVSLQAEPRPSSWSPTMSPQMQPTHVRRNSINSNHSPNSFSPTVSSSPSPSRASQIASNQCGNSRNVTSPGSQMDANWTNPRSGSPIPSNLYALGARLSPNSESINSREYASLRIPRSRRTAAESEADLTDVTQALQSYGQFFDGRSVPNAELDLSPQHSLHYWQMLMQSIDVQKDELSTILGNLRKKIANKTDHLSGARKLIRLFEQSVVLLCGCECLNWSQAERQLAAQSERILQLLMTEQLEFDHSDPNLGLPGRILDALSAFTLYSKDRQQHIPMMNAFMTAYQLLMKKPQIIDPVIVDRLYVSTLYCIPSEPERLHWLAMVESSGHRPGSSKVAVYIHSQSNVLGFLVGNCTCSQDDLAKFWTMLDESEKLLTEVESSSSSPFFRRLRLAIEALCRAEILHRIQRNVEAKQWVDFIVAISSSHASLKNTICIIASACGPQQQTQDIDVKGLFISPHVLESIEQGHHSMEAVPAHPPSNQQADSGSYAMSVHSHPMQSHLQIHHAIHSHDQFHSSNPLTDAATIDHAGSMAQSPTNMNIVTHTPSLSANSSHNLCTSNSFVGSPSNNSSRSRHGSDSMSTAASGQSKAILTNCMPSHNNNNNADPSTSPVLSMQLDHVGAWTHSQNPTPATFHPEDLQDSKMMLSDIADDPSWSSHFPLQQMQYNPHLFQTGNAFGQDD